MFTTEFPSPFFIRFHSSRASALLSRFPRAIPGGRASCSADMIWRGCLSWTSCTTAYDCFLARREEPSCVSEVFSKWCGAESALVCVSFGSGKPPQLSASLCAFRRQKLKHFCGKNGVERDTEIGTLRMVPWETFFLRRETDSPARSKKTDTSRGKELVANAAKRAVFFGADGRKTVRISTGDWPRQSSQRNSCGRR